MKKSTKALLALGAVIATPVIINKVIAKKAKERISAQAAEEDNGRRKAFDWEYGAVSYITAGDEGAPPLLLIHGLYPGACGLEWEKTMEHFAAKYHVYAIDLLGFGYSSKPALEYCSYLYVRLIKDFIENVIGKKVTAAASLHSAAALTICAELNPEDFERILLVSPTGLESNTMLARDEDGYLKKVLDSPIAGTSVYNVICSKKALPEFFEKHGLIGLFDQAELDKFYLAAHYDGANGKHALSALLAKFFNTDIKSNLAALEVPYHIILGEHLPPGGTEIKLWAGIDESYAATVLEGMHLLPHLEAPEEFVEAVGKLF